MMIENARPQSIGAEIDQQSGTLWVTQGEPTIVQIDSTRSAQASPLAATTDLASDGVQLRRKVSASADFLAIRLVDIVASIGLILFLAPLLITVWMLVKLQDGGPSVFRQKRIGLNGRLFECLKFRSMVTDSAARLAAHLQAYPEARLEWERDQKLKDDPRITRLGRFLRASSIDELPQLFNVLFGQMSLVGPRPIVQAETIRYGRSMDHYVRCRPGITGLWQISGRSNVSYRRRVAMDRLFAQRTSLRLYFYILIMTLPAVLLGIGAY